MREPKFKVAYKATKVNKNSIIYQTTEDVRRNPILTHTARVEKFMGFSKAYNLADYFRIRNTSNWQTCKQVTGLWKTSKRNIYYGDFKSGNRRTLMLFRFDQERSKMLVYLFEQGYYPSREIIENIVTGLQSI